MSFWTKGKLVYLKAPPAQYLRLKQGKSMSMLVGTLTWLRDNKSNCGKLFKLSKEETEVSFIDKVPCEKELPSWFSVEKMEKNRFQTDQEKLIRDFNDYYSKPVVNLTKETAEKHLTAEDLEFIDIKGSC